jgi:hypothetical protein
MIARLLLLLGGLAPAWAQAQNGTRLARYQTEKFILTAGPCAADGYWVTILGRLFHRAGRSTFTRALGPYARG